MKGQEAHPEPVGYGVYVLVWLGLLIFTGLTVGVAGVDLRNLAVLAALTVASVKTILVISVFMHVKYDAKIFKRMLFLVIVVLAVILALTFFDVSFR